VVAACASKPPPSPPKPAPEPVASAKPEPPPPPPKCEALEEHCVAKDGAKAKIVDSPLRIEPPSGWEYAQEKDATVAIQGGASLAVTTHDVGDARDLKKQLTLRLNAFDALLKLIGVKPPAARFFWMKTPEMVKKIGDLKVTLWQLDGATKEKTKGPLVVFVAPLPQNKALLGVGYVPDDDKSGADQAILKAVDSLSAPVDPASP